jgi:hypothetical protein
MLIKNEAGSPLTLPSLYMIPAITAMYQRFPIRFKTFDISNLSKVFEAIKKL